MSITPTPREQYDFGAMKVDEVKRIDITKDTRVGARALCAAYAFGRRNNKKFCGATTTEGKKTFMLIRRVSNRKRR